MKNMKYFLTCATLALLALPEQTLMAQSELPDDAYPVIITPHKQTLSYRERTLCYDITANVDYTVTSDVDWATILKADDNTIYVHLESNAGGSTSRAATITFANEENGLSEALVITQGKDESFEELATDTQVMPSSATANTANSDAGIKYTYDEDESTMWHSAWSSSTFTVSATNPAIITYYFTDVELIDYAAYTTRQSGSNGNFGEVDIYAIYEGVDELTYVGSVDWGEESGTHKYTFEGGLVNPTAIQFQILSGYGDFASCAEMRFFVDNSSDEFSIFADDSYSSLAEGTTQEDIDNLENEFIQTLAQNLYDGTYEKDYRVANYTCLLSPDAQSDLLAAPGKYYDQIQGTTGITFTAGSYAIAVSGLAENESVPFSIIAWYTGTVGSNFDGGDPAEYEYSLQNGLNIIEYTGEYDGLGYICYYADANPELQPELTVHFINGVVNGYLSLDKTNEEMHELCYNAPNICIDVVGNNVHSIWTSKGLDGYSEGLYSHCLAVDGTSLGYRQFIHVLDSLVIWEHELLGLHKYDLVPDNRTTAYVNFTYYMFQGSRGVSFHVDQESRVLNCKTLIKNDNDAIWGLSHEWGHLHQMTPYFCWAGMTEITNNMNSYYNIMRMGYKTSDKINNWPQARTFFIDNDYSKADTYSSLRSAAYQNASNFSYSSDMKNLCLAMKDSLIYSYEESPTKALSANEVDGGYTLCAFIMLYNYFTTHGFPDFGPDWYEALRENDNENGSQIEKQGEVDKYELIASAQNNNANGKYSELKASYPTSCWIKNGYIQQSTSNEWQNSVPYILNYIRKTSRLTGYNLTPYFEQWGFLRQIAMYIYDYAYKWYVMTEDMYNEFIEDMDALVESGELQEMPEGMIEEISNSEDIFQSTPTFEN